MQTILSKEDISAIKVVYTALSLLSEAESKELECIFFNQEGEKLSVLTTNNFPEKYHNIVDIYKEK